MRGGELLRRLGWSAWALVPVALLAFHFGPGRTLAAREVAAVRFREASELERAAIELQAKAHLAHVATIDLRRRAFLEVVEFDGEMVDDARTSAAVDRERIAYESASAAWGAVADAYAQVEARLVDDDPRTIDRVRWSKARARVRSGAIWDGVADLETLVVPRSASPMDEELARAAREELATAHYFGARLLRMAGEPARVWRAEAIKARQHFRLLAETAAAAGVDAEVVRGLEDNVERTIDLEQMDKSELQARALPRESPRATRGRRPGQGREGVSSRPPTRRDGRGAGGPGPIGPGW